jgi:exonuclease SbcD
MIRILHTADWHLGQKLQGWLRIAEQARVLDELVDVAVAREIDALIIAGDVFDTQNPPADAEALFYRTIMRLVRERPGLAVLVAAGNHDPAHRIEAPRPIYAELGVHAVGSVRRLADGAAIDLDRHLIALRRRDGTVGAHVLLLPHLGPASLPPYDSRDEVPGSPIVRAVARFHAEAIASARALIGAAPLVVTGHLTVSGAAESEGAERRIIVGGEHAVPPDLFPPDLAYVALGHLHKPQDLRAGLRYAGSLIPLSATERTYRHGVTLVTVAEGGTTVEHVPLARPVPFLRVPETGTVAPDGVEAALAALGLDPNLATEWRPFVHLHLHLDGPAPGLKAELDRIAEKHPVRMVGHVVVRAGAPESVVAEPAVDLAELDPADLFARRFAELHGGAPDERHRAAFARALAEAEA